MKLRIHGDMETTYGMAHFGLRPPFSFPNQGCVMRENDNGEEYPKYVKFDEDFNMVYIK